MSIDDVVGKRKVKGLLKYALFAGLAGFLSLMPVKNAYSQGEPEWKTVTTKTQLFKSDSSAFSQGQAGINIDGNDINDSTAGYFITTGNVPPDGYVELTFDILTRMPAPSGVVDVKQGFVPEGYGISLPYPNPVKGRTRFDVSVPERTSALLSLYDVTGEKIYSESMGLERAVSVLELSGVEDLPPSVYFVSVTGSDNNFLLSGKFVRMNENDVYGNFLSKSSGIPVSDNYDGNYDFDVVGERPYVDPSPDKNNNLSKGSGVDGDIVSDKIAVQWVVQGFDSGHNLRNLWVWNDSSGTYDFQDVIVDTFHLPYPTSSQGAGFYPEDKPTINVNKNYFQTNPEINFNNNDAKKD